MVYKESQMNLVFLSNYLNHHQLSLCEALYYNKNVVFRFVATTTVGAERLELGYVDMNKQYPFVITAYDNADDKIKALEVIANADVVIIGSAPDEYIRDRLKQNKIVFRYSERVYKKKISFIRRIHSNFRQYLRYCHSPNQYLLCASAFAASDYSESFSFVGKAYKWGYFPEYKKQNIDLVINRKKAHSILWVARFIDWKHPEICIDLAKNLLEEGITDFKIEMIGTGAMINQIKSRIVSEHLDGYISVPGSMKPEEVRKHMEESEIFIFTSDKTEGWGTVLNEAMNSGCAVVASSEIGSVPYLINDQENGLIYQDGNTIDLTKKVKELYSDSDKRRQIGTAAYNTIANLWNAEIAAERLLNLIDDVNTSGVSNRYITGPCSKAEILKDGWYK